jgi:guanylate kinase
MLVVFSSVADQPGSYDHVIVNDDVDVAYDQLKQVAVAVSTSF